ncbi:MAG TPA: DUF3015 family protein [bacterium]|nr:DUF3015 family protein [bacterium]
MKKLLVLSAFALLLAAPTAFAGNSAGCGLGHLLWTGQSGMVANVLGATTNGTFGSQTFGITTGTSGCNANDTVYNQTQQEQFVSANMDKLSTEMAQGNGEYVSALAELMGCNAAAQPEFAHMSQSKYESLFASDADAQAWLGTLKAEMSKDAVLSHSCSRIS